MQYFKEEQRTVCDDSCVRVAHCSYAARPAVIGSKVLVRIYERRIEIRNLQGTLLRAHAKAKRAGTVVLPEDERVFNPSRQTRQILRQAAAIGPQASRLCELLFTIEGRVGQHKLWGIVGLARHYPAQCVEAACEQAMAQGLYSYKQVKAMFEQAVAKALAAMQPSDPTTTLTQQHSLIREPDEYAEPFALAATATTATGLAATTMAGGQA